MTWMRPTTTPKSHKFSIQIKLNVLHTRNYYVENAILRWINKIIFFFLCLTRFHSKEKKKND